jgi:hypothetical protein
MSFIYLAQPYTHKDESVRAARFRLAEFLFAHYTNLGEVIFSPIVHCHRMSVMYEVPSTADYWEKANKAFLDHATAVRVMELPGWEHSKGLTFEMEYWKDSFPHVPLQFVSWKEILELASAHRSPDGDKPLHQFLEIASKV